MKRPPEAYWSLFKVAHERIVPLLKEGIRPGLLNSVFGLPQPKNIPKGLDPSANERYWLNWFQEFNEIHNSVDRIRHALVYLSHYPRSKSFRFHGVSEADWLRYHIEAYLQETYILFERLSRFLRKVEKATIGTRDKAGLGLVRKLKAQVEASFRSVVKVRGGHVHEHRFQDDELRNLDSLVLLTKSGKMRELRALREIQYLSTLLKWRTQLRKNNKEIQGLCVALFQTTASILKDNEPPLGKSGPVSAGSARPLAG